MLLTGFDAPVEQVMYLDAPLKEHTLLQAIARVNRPHGDEKTYGLVVDYWGVSAKLQDALAVFSTTDVQGRSPRAWTSCRGSRAGTRPRCGSSRRSPTRTT